MIERILLITLLLGFAFVMSCPSVWVVIIPICLGAIVV
jgi:hypothetical protein